MRTVGHDALDFRPFANRDKTHSGGVDFCVNLEEPANAGIAECMTDTKLGDIYDKWCG